jgi:hypothetical protein
MTAPKEGIMSESEKSAERVKLALKDFSGEIPKDTDFWGFSSHKPPREDFPVPELVLIVLRNIMGFPWSGPGEKVRWSVYCTFKGEPLAFELRKSGFTVCHANASPIDLNVVLGKLKKATQSAEDILQQMADHQAEVGNVTIANLYRDFDGRYRFFRENAEVAYVTPVSPLTFDKGGKPTSWEFMKGPREGSYYTAAMIDAFFGRLEHLLVLVLPFTDFVPTGNALRRFIAITWDDKFKMVFDIRGDSRAKLLYDRLKEMKERLRNPFSHGGFEKGWASLYFHFPTVGAIPASLTRFRDSVQFNFLPVGHDDHQQVCTLFDAIDDLLATGRTKMGYEYAKSGLHVAFDEDSLKRYKEAMKSKDALKKLIDRQSRLWELHVNMDY